ncbi:hypothetical protein DFH07DRAFT_470055 [Mycena maculata]|uniref:F-box domain-containing protein n=1 Tax=Mycena maculata TaxID=230809 RepID=A0AAD7NXX8_9AGAR|nr:hypothetical protein DFH07DRAFT_470055 [Mycena maculata]
MSPRVFARSPSIFSNLPLDTLEIVLRHVGPADLTSVCRVSKIFSPRALDALYRDVVLTDSHSLKACFSILDDPRLAARVKCLAIHSHSGAGSFYGVIQETLTVLTNLRVLELFLGEGCEWILPVDACPFQLHAFSTDFQYTPDVGTFIAGQHVIKELKVSWAGGPNYFGNLEFLGLRCLSTIRAPFSLVEALVPGRPVEEVATFRDRIDIHPNRINALANSTAISGIQRLQINLHFLHAIGPEFLAQAIPSLTCLVVTCGEPKGYNLGEWTTSFLASFPSLHCFKAVIEPHLWHSEYPHLPPPPLSEEQGLQYFSISNFGSMHLRGYVRTRCGKEWAHCSTDERNWLLAHSTFD